MLIEHVHDVFDAKCAAKCKRTLTSACIELGRMSLKLACTTSGEAEQGFGAGFLFLLLPSILECLPFPPQLRHSHTHPHHET